MLKQGVGAGTRLAFDGTLVHREASMQESTSLARSLARFVLSNWGEDARASPNVNPNSSPRPNPTTLARRMASGYSSACSWPLLLLVTCGERPSTFLVVSFTLPRPRPWC